jgi:hypothetical protein
MSKLTCLVLWSAIVLTLAGVAACNPGATPIADATAVRAYADPATETTLQGLSEQNLAKYTRYGNAAFKAALTQEILDKTATQVNTQLGAYQSKEFLRTESQQGLTIVHYRAKYTNGEVGVRMVFDKDHLVAGQWFE